MKPARRGRFVGCAGIDPRMLHRAGSFTDYFRGLSRKYIPCAFLGSLARHNRLCHPAHTRSVLAGTHRPDQLARMGSPGDRCSSSRRRRRRRYSCMAALVALAYTHSQLGQR
jgi:hypothetical protein